MTILNRRSVVLGLLFSLLGMPALSVDCKMVDHKAGSRTMGEMINAGNWYNPEFRSLVQYRTEVFLPRREILQAGAFHAFKPTESDLVLEQLQSVDPVDGQLRDVGFLIDSRLKADAVLVIRNNRILREIYRNGIQPSQAKAMFLGSYPLVEMVGRIAISQRKLNSDQAILRYLPPFAQHDGLRKFSTRRILDGADLAWTDVEVGEWERSVGWTGAGTPSGISEWLLARDRWQRSIGNNPPEFGAYRFELDLVMLAMTHATRQSYAGLFCQYLLKGARPEFPVYWITDQQGKELSNGLVISIRDLARVGQYMLDTHSGKVKGAMGNWVIDSIVQKRRWVKSSITGFPKDSHLRGGFVHLSDAQRKFVLLGDYGTSLYINLDKQLLIAVYGNYPAKYSPLLNATLYNIWSSIEKGTAARGSPN